MLLTLSAKCRNSKTIGYISKFLYSPYYILLVGVATVCSNAFGWEIPIWYLFALLAVLALLFAQDSLPFAPLLGCGYVSVSAGNNPASHYGTSIFQTKSAMVHLGVIVAVLFVVLIARALFDATHRKSLTRTANVPKLAVGFFLLGIAYICAGLFPARDYGPQWKSALFGLVQIACLAVPYLYFHYTVDWSKVRANYLAWIFVGLGFVVTAEIAVMYILTFASLPQGVAFDREFLVTGWGIYNNVGLVIAFCIPFAFYLALRARHGYLWWIAGLVFVTALLFTQSRGCILSGSAVALVTAVYTLVKCKNKKHVATMLIAGGVYLTALAVFAVIFREKIAEIFNAMHNAGFDDSGRFEIYRKGLEQFSESVGSIFLGNGFYACDAFRFGELPSDAFLPPRYHNTVVQLLATGGLFAMVAYLFHRVQTFVLCLKHRTPQKIFALFAILILISASMVDCHFFNMGPGLIYSVVLVFAENVHSSNENSTAKHLG